MAVKVRKARKRDEVPVAVAVCVCRQPPYPVATFTNETLVSVVLLHWARDRCRMPPVDLDPKTYLRRA
jgi:hypothetical protein